MNCPKCNTPIPDAMIAKALGAKGGKAGNPDAKRLSSEQARANVMKRWNKVKAARASVEARKRKAKQ